MSKDIGLKRERELSNLLWDAGFAVVRSPNSGGGTSKPQPDLIAGNGQIMFAIEAKYRTNDRIYITDAELESLLYFSQNFGARPRVAARFDYMDWRFFHPGELYRTDGGNYRISRETLNEGVIVEDVDSESAYV